MFYKSNLKKRWLPALFFLLCIPSMVLAAPFRITDDTGRTIHFKASPSRVVSLVPSATEIVFEIGAGNALCGITYHSASLQGAAGKALVGGFRFPSAEKVMALDPDLVIVSSLHADWAKQLDADTPLMVMQTRHMDDAFEHMARLGTLFGKQAAADALIAKNRQTLDLISQKVAGIPSEKRKRVMRLMGANPVTAPGDDSFQNEIIRAAGGIPPNLGKNGAVVPVTLDEWKQFNPQLVYACGEEGEAARAFLKRDGWNQADAVRNYQVHVFPCFLTCRAGAHLGDFVMGLSSQIYFDEFSRRDNEILPRKVIRERTLAVDLPYVKHAAIATSTIHDFINKTLIVDFKNPQTVVSTLEGQREGVLTAGNHYSSPACWPLMPMGGLEPLREMICPVIDRRISTTALLFTGADMDMIAVKKESFKEMTVYALVTAGVRGNAVRMGTDTGNYYEPGTINMIFLTNRKLTPRAMTRAIISATEGKSAALQDLDIRSSYQSLTAAATGTGTDNIIVVSGEGPVADNAGGHCKMGELIARAAHAGVTEAIYKQNGIVRKRDVFERLRDRHLSIPRLAGTAACECRGGKSALAASVEQILLDPVYAGFLEAAMAISDGTNRDTVNDLQGFETWCLHVAGEIAGRTVDALAVHVGEEGMPAPLSMALDALFTGVVLGDR